MARSQSLEVTAAGRRGRWLGGLLVCTGLAVAPVGQAAEPETSKPAGQAGSGALVLAKKSKAKRPLPRGRPDVVLNRLDFPEDVKGARGYKKQLKQVLKREVRRVEWGAGTGNRIEYRFAVTRLEIQIDDDLVKVTCSATGRLPKGKTAKSHLTFGGAASKRRDVVRRVLEIVARGVIARLAELERERRGYE